MQPTRDQIVDILAEGIVSLLIQQVVSESPTHPSHQTPICVSVAGRTGRGKETHP